MRNLLKEAALDDRFNTQMKKIEDAIDKLRAVLGDMDKSGGITKPVSSQKMAIRHASEDLKRLHDGL
jgi:hypothetical protein